MQLRKSIIDTLRRLPRVEGSIEKKCIKALQDSILHWEQVRADPKNVSVGARDCACCEYFKLCGWCPLLHGEYPRETCCDGRYHEFEDAKTMRNATSVLRFIEAIRDWCVENSKFKLEEVV